MGFLAHESGGRSTDQSYNTRHPTLTQTWIAAESKRRVQQDDRDYDEVYEEVQQRVFEYGRHIDELLGGTAHDGQTGAA